MVREKFGSKSHEPLGGSVTELCQSYMSIDRHIRLAQTDKSAVAEHSFNHDHRTQYSSLPKPDIWIDFLGKRLNLKCTHTILTEKIRPCGKKWGLRPGMVHWLYTRVIRPFILYGALVWWPKVIQKPLKLNQAGFKEWPAQPLRGLLNRPLRQQWRCC